jgi:hypothetical protein
MQDATVAYQGDWAVGFEPALIAQIVAWQPMA